MLEWLEGMAGPQFATAVVWTLAALILLIVLLVVIRLVRSLTFGTFVAGGRNRKTRLAVMDATAVDSHRRLVLVRRDDVEHLILIGGPTDVVVEREIRLGQPRRPAFGGVDTNQEQVPLPRPRQPEPPPPAPMRQPQVQQAPRQERPAPPPRAVERPQPAPRQPSRPPQREVAQREPAQPPKQAPRLPPATMPSPQPAPLSAAATPRHALQAPSAPARSSNLDDTLLKELEISLDSNNGNGNGSSRATPARQAKPAEMPKPAKPVEMSLDDEMTRLLGELSSQKR